MPEGTLVGHWANLAEAQKLTQDMKLRGVVQEIINIGGLVPRLPVRQIIGKQMTYPREKAVIEAEVIEAHGQTSFQSDVEYDEVSVGLKTIYSQRKLHHFEAMNYGSINDYRAQKAREMAKGVGVKMERQLIYGSTNNSSQEFDGLHALNITNGTADATNIDQDGALSLMNMRILLDEVKVPEDGRDSLFFLAPKVVVRRLSAYMQEAGLSTNTFGQMTFGQNDVGRRIMMFDGVPIVTSTFMTAETINTGITSGTRERNPSSGTRYSMFLVRTGQAEEGGVGLGLGGQSREVESVFAEEDLGPLPDALARGSRMYTFAAPFQGATHALGRIVDISDEAVVA